MDRRTQGRTLDPALCPVQAWARAYIRVMTLFPHNTLTTPISALRDHDGHTVHITASKVTQLLQSTCRAAGGYSRFGIHPHSLGTRSIRSGAAMALFLNNHSADKIQLLGRWRSNAFLRYIRPQALEWTDAMARDMAQTREFLDLNHGDESDHDMKSKEWRKLGMMPSFPIHPKANNGQEIVERSNRTPMGVSGISPNKNRKLAPPRSRVG